MKSSLKRCLVFAVVASVGSSPMTYAHTSPVAVEAKVPVKDVEYTFKTTNNYVIHIALHDYGVDFSTRLKKYGAKIFLTEYGSGSAIAVNQNINLNMSVFSSNTQNVSFTIQSGEILSNEVFVYGDHEPNQSDIVGYQTNPTTYNGVYIGITGDVSYY